jgi:regulator of protease activity HflC (stomatin/prohibitin superfamily)
MLYIRYQNDIHQEVVMTKEKQGNSFKGWNVVALHALLIAAMAWIIIEGTNTVHLSLMQLLALLALLIVAAVILPPGYFTLQPNEAKVLVLFGRYKGTITTDGFHWTNPLQLAVPRGKYTISRRIRNFEIEKLKVNDKRGNPIEIAAVVVWRVVDTAHALFDVDHYEHYVKIQSDAALRHLANCYPYDHGEEEEVTLRSGMDEVALVLKEELQQRLAKAGVQVDETRLTHLAYAPEIANAMLRRQQAEAIIAARRKIVHGAVSMVEMALDDLKSKKVVDLDEERKAAMVSNLLVVLCGEAEAQPVINAGTLYK